MQIVNNNFPKITPNYSLFCIGVGCVEETIETYYFIKKNDISRTNLWSGKWQHPICRSLLVRIRIEGSLWTLNKNW